MTVIGLGQPCVEQARSADAPRVTLTTFGPPCHISGILGITETFNNEYIFKL